MSKELKAMQDISDARHKVKNTFKISFDFDNTLDQEAMQNICRKFLKLGAEVFITTSRATHMHSNILVNHDDLFEVSDQLGIKRENITFTGYEDKYTFLKDLEIDIHYDDDIEEIFLINANPMKCMGFLFEQKPNNGIINY